MAEAIVKGWPFISSVIGPFTTLLLAYFGQLRKENCDNLNAASGKTIAAGLFSAIGSLIKR